MQGGKWLKAVGNVRRILQMTGAPPPKTPLLHSRGLSHIEGRDLYRDRRGWSNVLLYVYRLSPFLHSFSRVWDWVNRADNFLFVAGLLEGRNWKCCAWVQQIANQTIKCASRQERGRVCRGLINSQWTGPRASVPKGGLQNQKVNSRIWSLAVEMLRQVAARRRECLRFPDD